MRPETRSAPQKRSFPGNAMVVEASRYYPGETDRPSCDSVTRKAERRADKFCRGMNARPAGHRSLCTALSRINPRCDRAWGKFRGCMAKHTEDDVYRVYRMPKYNYCRTFANLITFCSGRGHKGTEWKPSVTTIPVCLAKGNRR